MATPLSDEIRALITFANETTEAGDTKLGDCVKTLCEGYNGGKNVPSSPLVLPQGAISSRLAALLAYANETTGAGDTTMGDAIRTLCEGYGGEQLVFYEKLITDGTAWINTGFIFTNDVASVRVIGKRGAYSGWTSLFGDGQDKGTEVYFYSSRATIYATYSQGVRVATTFNYGTWSDELDITLTSNGTAKTRALHNNTTNTDYNGTATGASVLTNVPMYLFATNNNGTKSRQQARSAYIRSCRITEDGVEKLHLVPCTYNGEAGMWDLVSQTFYGNAASSGQFTVEGEIVMYDRLIGDGTAYIDTGILATPNDRYYLGFQLMHNATYAFFGAWNTGGSRLALLGRSPFATRKDFPIVYLANTQRSLTVSGTLSDYHEGYVDLPTLTAEWDGIVTSFVAGTNAFPQHNINLFTTDEHTYFHSCKFSHFKLERDGETLMDLKPCTYNGVAGMWDKVSWKFYGNSNTSGAFTAENES